MKFASAIASATAVLALCQPASAQTYPTRPIRFIHSSAAGGGADVLVRFIAARVQPLAGQPIVVEGKPGANGNIANEAVLTAKPDGYTVLFAASSAVIANRYTMKGVTFDPMKDLDPVGSVYKVGLVLTLPPTSTFKNVNELAEHLKSKQGKVLYGVATTSTLAASELFKQLTGTRGEPVAYKSMADSAKDVASGDIDYAFIDTTLGVGQGKSGRVRVLGTSTAKRLDVAPDLPTLGEIGLKDYEYINFWGAWMPAKSPPEAVTKLSAWLQQVVTMDETRKFLVEGAGEVWPSDPQGLTKQMVEHDALWQRIVKAADIKPQ